MLNAVRTCLRTDARKRSKNVRLNKSTEKKKPELKTLPVFQYPVSDAKDHRIYVWGMAEHGALGTLKQTFHMEGVAYMPRPKRLSFGERHRITDITCGYGFTAFAVHSKDKNILYGSGINTDSQLGFNEMDKKFPSDLIIEPRPITLPTKESSTKVIDIAAGRAHLLVLTNEGLFTLGNNAYGQCGRPVIENENYSKSEVVHHIADIKGKKIKAVTAGQDHSILLTESGEVYTFGWGADGQTGLAHYHNEHRPSLVKGDLAGQHIIKVACVADCVLALSDKGKVFGWGNSEYGQLLTAKENHQVNIATELNQLKELGHISDIASGGCFCMILNNEGDVYIWGYGILGFGPEVKSVLQPTQIPSILFGKNAYEKNSKVIKIFCGLSHLAALTNTGDLYMWGCNKFGSLGLGHLNHQYFPLKVTVGAQVKKVACGVDHTVSLCKPFI
ncbi:PREDICTED: Williams-Beuren syndrome chromosomal region 16 protein homolog [Dufourea novaeangliae]|uniref:Williams-Beuren syndrome chromosomal region 16 protein like protein n=1 Tax=Dufourea novaeangliae TaxID=178035 RepID=A0A154PT08_DUFNO|nr:PREDICTED: Williams-Beuren syndrome chromosomal region 16 protein homolog [Dufourea novaeangliae]KZC14464.1 Williams-Beuren syndrome chromosomal region 16 protein like protein [Dufourea novaeangliae]